VKFILQGNSKSWHSFFYLPIRRQILAFYRITYSFEANHINFVTEKTRTISSSMKGIITAFVAVLFSLAGFSQLPSVKSGNLKINDLVRNFSELKQGELPFYPVKLDDKLANPLYPKKVNMQLNGKFSQSYFYDLKIINALGYKDDRSVSLYFLVPGNEGLIQMINDDLGVNANRTSHGNTPSGAYKWEFNGYTVTISANSSVFNEAEPAPFYYEVSIRNAGPLDEPADTNVTE